MSFQAGPCCGSGGSVLLGASEEHTEWDSKLSPGARGQHLSSSSPPPLWPSLASHLCECPEGLPWSQRSPGAEWSQVPLTGAVRCHLGKAGAAAKAGSGRRAREAKVLPGVVTNVCSWFLSLQACLTSSSRQLASGRWVQPRFIRLYFLHDAQCAAITTPPFLLLAPGVVSTCADAFIILVGAPC